MPEIVVTLKTLVPDVIKFSQGIWNIDLHRFTLLILLVS